MFWFRVKILLYLVKQSRPDIAIMTGELSKVNDCVNPAAFCKLLHVIRYVLVTKNLCLKLEPSGDASEPWKIVCFNDSDYTSLFMLKSTETHDAIKFRSKWVALSEALEEVMLVIQLL